MIKNIVSVILAVYIIITVAYFAKLMLNKYNDQIITEAVIVEKTNNCQSFSVGHIVAGSTEFRVFSRINKDAQTDKPDENRLAESVMEISCDRQNDKALIFYDSKPIAIASVSNFDYSKPIAEKSDEQAILYTVLNLEHKIAEFPDNGYVVAVFDYDESKIEKYATESNNNLSNNEDNLILGACDTIYYEAVSENPSETEIEYSYLKTDLNNNGITDFIIMPRWYTESLPKNVYYTSIFALYKNENGSLNRVSIFAVHRVRRSSFFISNVVDLDNDGYKEVIIRKNRENRDTFIIYKYFPDKKTYLII